jgi:hypothetical protein
MRASIVALAAAAATQYKCESLHRTNYLLATPTSIIISTLFTPPPHQS